MHSVIQSIQAQDVAGRAEPKNASLKQLNVMLCMQTEFGFGRGEKFPCFFAISVVATNSLCNGGAGTVAGERGSRGMDSCGLSAMG